MLEIDWQNERRNPNANKYLVDPNGRESRRVAFLSGWKHYLKKRPTERFTTVSWRRLGMLYASVLGNIAEDERKQLYRLLLSQYLSTDRVKHWTDEQRQGAMRLANEE
jgi:hypothetical protein